MGSADTDHSCPPAESHGLFINSILYIPCRFFTSYIYRAAVQECDSLALFKLQLMNQFTAHSILLLFTQKFVCVTDKTGSIITSARQNLELITTLNSPTLVLQIASNFFKDSIGTIT